MRRQKPLPPWADRHVYEIRPVRDVAWIALGVFLLYMGYLLRGIFTPVLIALALAYAFNPLIDFAHKRLRIVPFDATLLAVRIARFGKLRRRLEYKIDRLLDLIGKRLERNDAILPDSGGNRSDDMQAAAAPGDVEIGLKPRQIPQSGHLSDSGPHRRIGHKIEMLSGLRDLFNRHGDVPLCSRFCRSRLWPF